MYVMNLLNVFPSLFFEKVCTYPYLSFTFEEKVNFLLAFCERQ